MHNPQFLERGIRSDESEITGIDANVPSDWKSKAVVASGVELMICCVP